MQTPIDKPIAFLFVSHPTKDLALRWTARLAFPMGATADSMLKLHIVDGHEKPIQKGIFEFAGQRLAVKDGEAEMTYGDFIRGKHEVALWLHRAGMPPIPGGLTFG